MKRTPMPPRGTPLRAYTELQRRTPLAPGGPLRPVSDKRRRDNYERRKVVSAMRLASKGECARCGRRDLPVHGHELRGRAHDSQAMLRPEALLCNPCNCWCEDEPIVAAWTGWKHSPKHPHDHTLQPWEARRLDGVIVDLRSLYAVEYEDVGA